MTSKDRFVQQLHTQIDEWSAQIDTMQAKAKQLEANTRLTYEKRVAELKAKLDAVRTKFDELKQTSGDTWEAVKRSLETGVNEFKTSYERLRSERKELLGAGK